MKYRYLAFSFALMASACTISPEGGGNVNLPLTYRSWQSEHYTNQSGARICTISSGYNGITVVLRHQQTGDDVFVRGNRILKPGVTLTINTNKHRFETYDAYFPAKASQEMVEDFRQGGRAYLEWSEIGGASGQERIPVQNILDLDGFASKLKECQDALKE